jgi:formylglycine-generating enzyme required for sulfatase activity
MTIRPYRVSNVDPYVLKPDAERVLKPRASFRECAKDCPEMIVVPAGEFMMGSLDFWSERSPHKVTIAKPFAVSKFEVTFEEWDACVDYGDCERADDMGWGRGRQPVINVNWHDAQRYVAWLSKMTGKPYRLLSEAEWEYAARAGTQESYSWGDEIGSGNANCRGCGSQWEARQTAPVGSFAPNAFGLYDMHGNVSEWVQDCAHGNYAGAPTDGSAWTVDGDCSFRGARGGSWLNDLPKLRSASRLWLATYLRFFTLGFRVGRTLTL